MDINQISNLILCWGLSVSNNNFSYNTITFPISFNSFVKVFSMSNMETIASHYNNSNNITYDRAYAAIGYPSGISLSGCVLASKYDIVWLAVGI